MKNQFKNLQDQKGSTLIAVVFFVSLLTLLGITATIYIQNNTSVTTLTLQNIRAFYTAQSAIEYAIKKSLNTSNWHWSASSQSIADGSAAITTEDSTLFPQLHDTMQVKVVATCGKATSRQTYRLRTTDISGLAVYVSGDLNGVTINDSAGNDNPALGRDFATVLPTMDTYKMKQTAIAQGHYFSSSLDMSHGETYPSGSDANFYHPRPNNVPSDTPNVVYVEGNLTLKNSAHIYGIIVVTGDVVIDNSGDINGVLYMPNPVSVVENVDLHNKSNVYGGIFGGTNVTGLGNDNKINIYYRASYVKKFFGRYSSSGSPFINTWHTWSHL